VRGTRQPGAHYGTYAVCPNQNVGLNLIPIGEANLDSPVLLIEAGTVGTQMDARGIESGYK
jgi:hypothetical protein